MKSRFKPAGIADAADRGRLFPSGDRDAITDAVFSHPPTEPYCDANSKFIAK